MKEYLTVAQTAQKYPFSESSIRAHIQNADTNGFDKVVKRIGRKVLIDNDAFVKWIEGDR